MPIHECMWWNQKAIPVEKKWFEQSIKLVLLLIFATADAVFEGSNDSSACD